MSEISESELPGNQVSPGPRTKKLSTSSVKTETPNVKSSTPNAETPKSTKAKSSNDKTPKSRTLFPSSITKMTSSQLKEIALASNGLAQITVEKLKAIGVQKKNRKEVFKALRQRESFKDFEDATIRAQIYLAAKYLEKLAK